MAEAQRESIGKSRAERFLWSNQNEVQRNLRKSDFQQNKIDLLSSVWTKDFDSKQWALSFALRALWLILRLPKRLARKFLWLTAPAPPVHSLFFQLKSPLWLRDVLRHFATKRQCQKFSLFNEQIRWHPLAGASRCARLASKPWRS